MKLKKLFIILSFIIYSSFCISYNYNRNLPGVKIITRNQWWANVSWLFESNSLYDKFKQRLKNLKKQLIWLNKFNYNEYKKRIEKYKIESKRIEYLHNKFKNEFKIDKVVDYLYETKLWWQLKYHYNKTKIVIHHTAANQSKYKNQEEFIKYLRWIYRFHTFTRWWWDIGYHFVIDPWWNIYEWKYWWEGIIWAHTEYNNPESIWIALAWDFDKEKPTKAQIDSLIKIITALCIKYHINPYKQVIYHKKDLKNKYPYIINIK